MGTIKLKSLIKEIHSPSEVEKLIKEKGYVKDFRSNYYPIVNVYPNKKRGIIVIEYEKGFAMDLDFSEIQLTAEKHNGKVVWRWQD